MNVIHSQTGLIETPLTTLGDQLSDPAKDLLQKTAAAAYAQAPLRRRAAWWVEANLKSILAGALVAGIVAGYALRKAPIPRVR